MGILKKIAETPSLIEYEDLTPAWNSIDKQSPKQEEPDSTDKYITQSEEPEPTIDRSIDRRLSSGMRIEFFSSNPSISLKMLCIHPSKRAFETKNFEEFSPLSELLYLGSLLHEISEQDLTLTQWKDISNNEIFDVILTFKSDSSEDEIDKRIERILLPPLELIDQSKGILERNLVRKL